MPPQGPFDPLKDMAKFFRVRGDVHLTACPVCGSAMIGRVWQLPQTRLTHDAHLASPGAANDGLYIHYLPMLNVPQDIFCYDACGTCEALFRNPKDDDQTAYARDASKVASFRANGVKEFEGSAANYRKRFPPGTRRVVDAACGAGQVLAILKRDMPLLELAGLELSRPAVDFMNKELGIRAHAVDLDLDDLSVHIPDGWADFVIFQEAFEHVRAPVLVTQKLMRMLRKGGRMHFTAQRYGADNELQIRVEEPIFINETTLDHVVRATGAKLAEAVKDIKLRVMFEKV